MRAAETSRCETPPIRYPNDGTECKYDIISTLEVVINNYLNHKSCLLALVPVLPDRREQQDIFLPGYISRNRANILSAAKVG